MWLFKDNDLFLLEQIVRKNFSSKYQDSVLGIFWSILKPLMIMIVFTIIFSTVFGRNIENYPIYFLSGRCIYDFFIGGVTTAMVSLKGNVRILKRTPAPKYIFILGSIISEFLNFLITLIILAVVMVVTHTTFYWSIMPISLIPIISTMIMATGLGLMLSVICVYYTDIQHLWSVITLVLMYGSAIFYPMEIVPEPYHQYMILNPTYWMVNQFRTIIYGGAIPDGLYMINLFLLSVIILVLGIIVFKKYEKRVTINF